MEIEARRAATPAPEMHAPAAHSEAPVKTESSAENKDLSGDAADIAPPQVVEVAPPDAAIALQAPLPREGERAGEGEEKT
jgi:hypothetical protein